MIYMSEESDLVEKTLSISKLTSDYLEREAMELGVEESELVEDLLGDGFYVLFEDAEESVVKIKYVEPWTDSDKRVMPPSAEGGDDEKTSKTFRRLRDEFPPVSAGIEYHRAFTKGGGFNVDIDDSSNAHQNEVKDVINRFNRDVYQDEVVRGLDAILGIMVDEAFTVGFSAAEIVYTVSTKGSINFHTFATSIEREGENDPEYETRDPTTEEWEELGGIQQLKFIDNALHRLKAYRNKNTYKIEYWTVDEGTIESQNRGKEGEERTEVPKLLPWQVLIAPYNQKDSSLKGTSMIRPVAETAIVFERILGSVGLSFAKWSDQKFFFVMGSETTGRTWAPPKIRNFLRDVKQMVSSGGTGIPVPAGFDVKSIGGDVFEGGTILDLLIGMIAGGMKYPRTFLEQGKSQEGDKAWLAWIVTYASHQQWLKRIIEHQLWTRHLYCIYGTTRKDGRQGKKVEEQDDIPIYVPSVSWRSEGKWHIQQKIDQLTKILNVANPVDAVLKLAIEMDLAATLGYSDTNFKVAIKVLKLRQELAVTEAQMDKKKADILMKVLDKAVKDEEFLESVIPIIQGTSKKEVPEEAPPDKRPPPVPGSRLAGGVSRTPRDKDTKKGVAKPMGGTRQPKVQVGESEELTYQFDSDFELLQAQLLMRELILKENMWLEETERIREESTLKQKIMEETAEKTVQESTLKQKTMKEIIEKLSQMDKED